MYLIQGVANVGLISTQLSCSENNYSSALKICPVAGQSANENTNSTASFKTDKNRSAALLVIMKDWKVNLKSTHNFFPR